MTKKIFSIIALLCMAVSGAWAYGIVCTAKDLGKVICTDGSIYATVTEAEAAGKTAAAMIAYLDIENKNGLAIALADKGGLMNWNTVNGASGVAAHTPAIEGQTWRLASEDEWKKMFKANGGNVNKYNGLHTAISKAGGTGFTSGYIYWSSTESSSTEVISLSLSGGNVSYYELGKNRTFYVRACFDFDIVTPTANANEWTFQMPAYDVEVDVEYETALALSDETDNAATLAEWNGCVADVTINRTLVTGGWNTFALPFSINAANFSVLKAVLAAQGGSITVKELTKSLLDAGTLSLIFDDASQIVAGKPYLVKVSSNLNLTALSAVLDANSVPNPFKGAVVSKTLVPTETDAVDFIPTLGKTLVTGPTGDESNTKAVLFLAAGNTLKYPTVVNDASQASSFIKGFRAYFRLKGEAAGARSFNIDFGDGETTSLTPVLSTTGEGSEYFDMQGRRVNGAAKKGVYIVNGKKVIVK